MYCTNCGSEMSENQEICLNCGIDKKFHSQNKKTSNKDAVIYQILFLIFLITTLLGAFGVLNNLRILLFSNYAYYDDIANLGTCIGIFAFGIVGVFASQKKLKSK